MNTFEWDENKQQSNLKKHGMDFVDSLAVFDDAFRVERLCTRDGEDRYETIGMLDGFVIFLVYTKRKTAYRIISARKASKKERVYYEKCKQDQKG